MRNYISGGFWQSRSDLLNAHDPLSLALQNGKKKKNFSQRMAKVINNARIKILWVASTNVDTDEKHEITKK